MQPYFLPYVGYFQLIASVDLFIVYDNIKYSKKGWVNRNRMLRNDEAAMISVPLQSGSDFLDIRDRVIAEDFPRDRLLSRVAAAYRRAPHFSQTFPLIEQVVKYGERNLFRFIEHSILKTCEHLGISTEVRRSSEVGINHALKGQNRVLALCEAVGATTYVNAIGGIDLYSTAAFRSEGIELRFIRSYPLEYAQFGAEFVPQLSILDVLMFNPLPVVREIVRTGYELV